MSLKDRAISGIKWTTLSTVIAVVTQILKVSILARFLSSEDFGLMALSMVFIGFLQVFSDGGISNAVIYKQEITEKQLSSLYWFNVLLGFTLFFIILIFSPIFSYFYNEPELNKIIPLVGLTVLFQSFSLLFKSLFEKNLLFNTLSKIEIISKIISLISAVYFAFEGYGVYSLVFSIIVMYAVETVLLLHRGIKLYRPVFHFSIEEIKFFITFGAFQLGERITNYFSSQLDILLIGKLLGTDAVGVYSVIKQIVMRPAYLLNSIITRVTFPVMSKFQEDIIRLKEIYLKTIRYVSSVNFPVYTGMFVLAPFLISILLGYEWSRYTYIFQLLSVYFMFRAIGNPVGSLLLSRGRPDIEFYWNIIMLLYIPLWIYLGHYFGLEGISLSLAISHILLVLIDWIFLIRPMCGASFYEYHREILIPLLISILTGILMYVPVFLLNYSYLSIIISLFTGTVVYTFLSMLFNRGFAYTLYTFIR